MTILTQKGTIYKPSKKERDLLEVLLNPEHINKSITAKCEIANVDRKVYYNAYKKPLFVEYLKQESKGLVNRYIPSIINKFGKLAEEGSYTHGLAILKMAGVYEEVSIQKIEADVRAKSEVKIEAEVRAKIEQEMHIYGEVNHKVEVEVDLSKFTDEELEQMEVLRRKISENSKEVGEDDESQSTINTSNTEG